MGAAPWRTGVCDGRLIADLPPTPPPVTRGVERLARALDRVPEVGDRRDSTRLAPATDELERLAGESPRAVPIAVIAQAVRLVVMVRDARRAAPAATVERVGLAAERLGIDLGLSVLGRWVRQLSAPADLDARIRTNHLVTMSHHLLDLAFREFHGRRELSNFFTIAKWGSIVVGQALRGRQTPFVEALARVPRVGRPVRVYRDRASAEFIGGNLAIIRDALGVNLSQLIERFVGDAAPDARRLGALTEELRASANGGEPATLIKAVECYYGARWARGREQRDLVLLGGLHCARHEQAVVHAFLLRMFPRSRWLRRLFTSALALPAGPRERVYVGRPIRRSPAFPMTDVVHPELGRLLHEASTTGVRDWTDFEARVRFIYSVFWAFAADPHVLGSPEARLAEPDPADWELVRRGLRRR